MFAVNRDTKQSIFENVSLSGTVGTADNLSVVPRSLISNVGAIHAKDTIYIQRIELAITTDNAATQQFRSDGTDIPVAGTKASPGIGPIEFDFGEEGFALPEGEGLELINSGAGAAYSYTIKAYRRRTGAGVPNPA